MPGMTDGIVFGSVGGGGGGGAGSFGSFNSYGSMSSEVPVISLDICIQIPGNSIPLGLQPLRYSLHELSSALANKKRFSDGQEWVRRFFFAPQGGLPVVRVEPNSPAAAAGLQMCDVIVSIDGRDCREWAQQKCAKVIKEHLTSSNIMTLSVIRCTQLPYDPQTCALFADQAKQSKGEHFQVTVRIPITQGSTAFGFTPLKYSMSDTDLPRYERCMVKEIRRKLPFAVGGLPVQSVDPDGAAAQAGLQAWDVIAFVNGVDVQTKTYAAITQLIKEALVLNLAHRPDDVLELRIVRSASPITQVQTPKSSALQRAISGLHFLSSPMKNKGQNASCPSFGTRASEVDTGDIVVADVATFAY